MSEIVETRYDDYVRNFCSTNNQQWLPGIILKRNGPVSYVVRLTDGCVFIRHQGHVHLPQDAGSEIHMSTEFPVVGPTPVGVGLPEGDTQAKGSVSLREDEHTHTDIQTPPSLPTPDSPKTHTPVMSAWSPGVVRRS